MATEFLWAFLR